MNYQELVDLSNGAYEFAPVVQRSLKLVGKKYPYSITEIEFNFIRDYIINNGYHCGFEIATGTGISTLAAALGFKTTCGRLCTVDSYIEESMESDIGYKDKREIYLPKAEPSAYPVIKHMIKELGLVNNVSLNIGWSPDNIPTIAIRFLDRIPRGQKIDFIFIDSGHWDYQLIADCEVLLPYLADNYVLFVHDMHCFSREAIEKIEQMYRGKFVLAPGCGLDSGAGFNLHMLTFKSPYDN